MSRWSADVFAGPEGTDTRLLAISNRGAAAGVRFMADGTPHGIHCDGRRVRDLSPSLGVVSSIAGINDRRELVGYASGNPAARIDNLFETGTDPKLIPHAFFRSGKRVLRLPMPSAATGINQGSEVVGTFRAPDGSLHAFLWRPRLDSERVLRQFVDLGPGSARAISDPLPRAARVGPDKPPRPPPSLATVREVIVGTRVWVVSLAEDTVTLVDSPPGLVLSGVNPSFAVGGEDGIERPRSTMLGFGKSLAASNLADPPGSSGSTATGTSPGGAIVGRFASADGSESRGALWMRGEALDVNALPGIGLPAGALVTDASAVNANGLIAATVSLPQPAGGVARNAGLRLQPTPATKRPTLMHYFDVYVQAFGDGDGEIDAKDEDGVKTTDDIDKKTAKKLLGKAITEFGNGNRKIACNRLERAHNVFDAIAYDNAQKFKLPHVADGSNPAYLAASGVGVIAALEELKKEMGC